MGAIKDLVDLATHLDKSISDRKVRDMFLPLKEKVLAVQHDQLEIEKRHTEEMSRLKETKEAVIADLKSDNVALVAENSRLKQQPTDQLRHDRSLYWSDGNTVPFCPQCWEVQRRSVHLFQVEASSGWEIWRCVVCHIDYQARRGSPFEPRDSELRV